MNLYALNMTHHMPAFPCANNFTNIVLMPLQNRRGCCPSANHPTRFCQAPNRFDKDAVKDIMFGRDDTKKDSNGVTVIPYSKLDERALVELAA